ncbi:phospholipid carrier-dependent glycosyltransferase [Leptospira semungkisensis]|uniref:Phospholipid carrier-dependent glycosyltransferase n=1 Tax=Leptospira semungkisensis TaxID=2484985 RepID=A0A4V3JBW8_9LEPT|nr:phospholipid carrier-dependent glycosyltransferase [Leptospira semungkisensis]TGK03819.1 phospholipid carrier-dependent glycosyltransferase [Leptospira semungkisensis]
MPSSNPPNDNSVSGKKGTFSEFVIQKISSLFSSGGDRLFLSLLILLNIILLLPGSGGNALLTQGDESMHIATIRESLASSSYLFPKFEGILNLYKPPALFWVGMASDALLGIGYFSERFPSFLLFCGTSVLIYIGLRRAGGSARSSFSISFAYTLTLGVFKFSRLAMMESLLAFFITAVSVSILEFRLFGNRIWLFVGGLLSGIAILIKGPVFQVYSGVILGSYSIIRVFLITERGIWTGKKRIWKELLNHIVFHSSSLIVPGIWIGVLLSYSELGKEFLKVFLFTENFGKFSAATVNQPEWIIPGGFLLYSFPFCIVLAVAFFTKLLYKARNTAELIGSSFLWTTVAIFLIHLSPNRKDFYYLLPIIPLAFLGLGLFSIRKKEYEFSRALIWNFFFSLAFSIILLLGMSFFDVIMEGSIWQEVLFFGFVFGIIWIFRRSLTREGVPSIVAANLLIGLGLLSYLQFSLLPRLSLNEVPQEGPLRLAKQVCIVSENPWTALTFKNDLPEAEIVHSVPGAERNCADGTRFLVVYQKGFIIPPGYTHAQTQEVWKRDISSMQEFLGPTKGKEQIYIFGPNRRIDSKSESR